MVWTEAREEAQSWRWFSQLTPNSKGFGPHWEKSPSRASHKPSPLPSSSEGSSLNTPHLGEVTVVEGGQQEALGCLLVLASSQLGQPWGERRVRPSLPRGSLAPGTEVLAIEMSDTQECPQGTLRESGAREAGTAAGTAPGTHGRTTQMAAVRGSVRTPDHGSHTALCVGLSGTAATSVQGLRVCPAVRTVAHSWAAQGLTCGTLELGEDGLGLAVPLPTLLQRKEAYVNPSHPPLPQADPSDPCRGTARAYRREDEAHPRPAGRRKQAGSRLPLQSLG